MRRVKSPDLVVGLDVGTTKICAVITEPAARGTLDVIGVGTAPSRGIGPMTTRATSRTRIGVPPGRVAIMTPSMSASFAIRPSPRTVSRCPCVSMYPAPKLALFSPTIRRTSSIVRP